MSDTESETDYLSPPILRAMHLLRHVAEGGTVANVARTARELKINRTTLLRLLHTLESEQFIEYQGEGRGWRIGLGLIGLAAQAFFSEDLVQLAVPIASRLTESLGLSAHLGVLDEREVIYVVRRTPNHAFASNIRVGSRLPAHATVLGRIILAHLPPERITQLYRHSSMDAATTHTPTTLADLQRQLKMDRQTGVAWSDGYFEPSIVSVASAIFDASGSVVAALNVSGQASSFAGAERRETIEREVLRGADEISRRLGWVGRRQGVAGEALMREGEMTKIA